MALVIVVAAVEAAVGNVELRRERDYCQQSRASERLITMLCLAVTNLVI